jgi:hypothetical protein
MESKKTTEMMEIMAEVDLPVDYLLPLHNSGSDMSTENQLPCYIHAATSNNTRTAYQADMRHFVRWGGRLPTSGDVILQYLRYHGGLLNPRTLARRLTAIKNWHLYQGFADPTGHPAIHKTLAGIKNVHGKPRIKATPLTLETVAKMSPCVSIVVASTKNLRGR